MFLFDRKVLRYFRKDGHNWRKKKDGKTVKEAHEKLKVNLGRFILLMIDRYLEALMCCTAIMLTEKRMKTSSGAATGCLKSGLHNWPAVFFLFLFCFIPCLSIVSCLY
nr:calmodulin-binding transcription activator 1 [Ipomoea batatas]